MAITSKTQLGIDIAASTFAAGEQTILNNMVDSYEDIFPQLTTVQRNALTPTLGQIIFNTDTARYEYWNGAAWFGIGQDLSTPLVVKIDLSNADLLGLHTTPVTIASTPGSGYAIMPISMAYRMTYATATFDFDSDGIGLFSSTKKSSVSNQFFVIGQTALNNAASTSGNAADSGGTSPASIVENDSLVLYAQANPTQGGGTLTVWVTYSVIVY